jgi:hypothetical protein
MASPPEIILHYSGPSPTGMRLIKWSMTLTNVPPSIPIVQTSLNMQLVTFLLYLAIAHQSFRVVYHVFLTLAVWSKIRISQKLWRPISRRFLCLRDVDR